MAFTIRPLEILDALNWHQLFAEALARHQQWFGTTLDEWKNQSVALLERRLQQETLIGAWDEKNKLIGIVGCSYTPLTRLRTKGHVYGAYVAPEMRAQGVMRALLQALEQKIDGKFQLLRASIAADNHAAERCFARAGYTCFYEDPYMMQAEEGWIPGLVVQKLL